MSLRRLTNDLSRILVPMAMGLALLVWGPDISKRMLRGEFNLWLSMLSLGLFSAGLSHLLRRLWVPYVELAELFRLLKGHPIGAGLGALGVCILLSAMLMSLSMSARAGTLPGEAERLMPTLQAEQQAHWPDHYRPAVFAAQIEQESRWRPGARLHTDREDGYGLAQFTVTPRFNAVALIIAAHPRELAGWGMSNVMDPQYQMRAMILLDRDLWRGVVGAESPDDQMAMALASYNGGPGSVAKRRAICRGTPGCNANRWWDNAELHAPQSRTKSVGYGKSFADINTEYPRLVMRTRLPKYEVEL